MICVNKNVNKYRKRSIGAGEILDVPTYTENLKGRSVGINESH
jgi:hypothetical protein